MQLFYEPNISVSNSIVTLSRDESRHIVRVLRLSDGDNVYIGNGRGDIFIAIIICANPNGCALKVLNKVSEYEEPHYRLIVGVAPTKSNERFEWFIEKATEIGITHIIPLDCSRSERHAVKPERGRRIIMEAAKQSLKASIPHLEDITPLKKILSASFNGVKLIACCQTEVVRKSIWECVKPGDDVIVLIGPEGDFSPDEVTLAVGNGFIPITLGKSRLRTETAALAAVMFMSFINRNE